MTASEKILLAAIKPLMPQIEKQLQPALEMFIEGQLKETADRKLIPNSKPAILICTDTNDNIYLCDVLLKGTEVAGMLRKTSLETLTKKIVANLTEL